MHCEELEEIHAHLLERHSFRLNPMRTVFYGVCGECAGTLEKTAAAKRCEEETTHD